ncbi:MAG: exonuclease domain-containing protein [Pseudomonadota bacterium]
MADTGMIGAAPRRVVIFDTETTGRSPLDGDRIVEIGCVEMIGFEVARSFHAYLNPERDVPEEVVRVHGLTGAFLRDKPLFKAVHADLMSFFGEEDMLVAHNAEFDRGFLNAELERLGLPILPQERFIDTLAVARKKLRAGQRLSLDALSKYYRLDQRGFDLTARKGAGGHGALLDAQMLAEVYVELHGGREQALAFAEKPAGPDPSAAPVLQIVRREQRPVQLSFFSTLEERAAHDTFVAELPGGSLWPKNDAA